MNDQTIAILEQSLSVVAQEREQDIVLLKRLRAEVLELMIDARQYSTSLGEQFVPAREAIDKALAYALLARETQA